MNNFLVSLFKRFLSVFFAFFQKANLPEIYLLFSSDELLPKENSHSFSLQNIEVLATTKSKTNEM